MADLNPIVRRVMNLCTSIVSQDVSLDVAAFPGVYTWHEITGVNRTNATTTIEIGLKRGREFYAYRCANAVAADRSVRLQTHIVAPEGFVPCARFKVAVAGDELELIVNGHLGHFAM